MCDVEVLQVETIAVEGKGKLVLVRLLELTAAGSPLVYL